MTTTLMIFQAIVSVLLIIIVLLQFGKGAEAGLMQGGGADSVFTGSQQGNILSKITIVLSVLFLGNSVLLAKLQSQKTSRSILDSEAPIARPLNSDAATTTPTTTPVKADEKKTEATTDKK